MTLLFAQISGKDSLREIENALLANHKRFYHLGMEAVAKSTLSEAMNRRNPEIFKALFEELLNRVEKPLNWNLPVQEELFNPLLL